MVYYPEPAYQKESFDLEAYGRHPPVVRQQGYSPWAKCCCCLLFLLLAIIITVAVLIVFLVRTPSVSFDHSEINCPDRSTCINAALDSIIPFTVYLKISNPNIIGADVSSSGVVIRDQDDVTVLATGEAAKQHVAAKGDTIVKVDLQMKVTGENENALKKLLKALLVDHQTYDVIVDAPVRIEFGALHPTINVKRTETLQPQDI